MTDEFDAMIQKHRARMKLLRDVFERDGCLLAFSTRNPDYSILLTRNPSSDAPWRVTSFNGREPVGHREYDELDGKSPANSALQEFSSHDLKLIPRHSLTALCIRTRVIGAGNAFEVLIALSEINPEGQTYRIIRPDQGNSEYVPFHLGISPYTSEIIGMAAGGERYERYKAHEAASKAEELAVLQHAFPESHLSELPFLWNRDYLADKKVTLRIDRKGGLLRPVAPLVRPGSGSAATLQPA